MLNTKDTTPNFLRQLCMISFLCISVLVTMLGALGITGIVRTGIMALLVYAPALLILVMLSKPFPFEALVILAAVALIYQFTTFVHPEYIEFVEEEMWRYVVSIYGGIIGYFFIRMSDDPAVIQKVLIISACVLFAGSFMQSIEAIRTGYWEMTVNGTTLQQNYSMSFGYNMLLPSTIFLFYGLRNKNRFFIILSLVGGLEIFMLGSRAAAMSLVLFGVLYLLLISSRITAKKHSGIIIVVFLLIILMFVFFYEDILLLISGLFQSIGFKSRTVARMLDGSFADDKIRSEMWQKTLELISSNPFFGKGFLSDRYFIGNYCHNIALELFLNFGFFAGGAIIIFLIYHTIKMLFRCKNADWLGIFLVFFSCCFLRLLVSYSFWRDTNFWMAVGVYVSWRKASKPSLEQKNTLKQSGINAKWVRR